MSLFSNMVKDFASLYGLIMIKIQFFPLAPLCIVYMRKVEKPAYMRKTAFVCMLENGWSFRALFRTFQPFCKNLLRRHSKITITRAKNSRQGHWSVACLKMLKGNYNQCNKHSFSDQYFENLVTSVEKKTPGPEIRIFSNFSCMFLNPNNFFQFEF